MVSLPEILGLVCTSGWRKGVNESTGQQTYGHEFIFTYIHTSVFLLKLISGLKCPCVILYLSIFFSPRDVNERNTVKGYVMYFVL